MHSFLSVATYYLAIQLKAKKVKPGDTDPHWDRLQSGRYEMTVLGVDVLRDGYERVGCFHPQPDVKGWGALSNNVSYQIFFYNSGMLP